MTSFIQKDQFRMFRCKVQLFDINLIGLQLANEWPGHSVNVIEQRDEEYYSFH